MARATSSLPVPLSPWIRIVTSVSATWRIRAKTSRMAALWPIISGISPAAASRSRSRRFSSHEAVVLEGVADLQPQDAQVDRLG